MRNENVDGADFAPPFGPQDDESDHEQEYGFDPDEDDEEEDDVEYRPPSVRRRR